MTHPASFPLSMADEGRHVLVVALKGGSGLDRRMTEMGLNVGAKLVVRQREGGGVVADETRRPALAGAGFLLGNLGAHGIHIQLGHLLQQRIQLPG